MSLVDFLLARLDEAETLTQSALTLYGSGTNWPLGHPLDPARVLADIAAKRRIIDLADDHTDSADPIGHLGTMFYIDGYGAVLQALAQPYADHPDFDLAWT